MFILSLEFLDLEKLVLIIIVMYCCFILIGILCIFEYKIYWEEVLRECKIKYEFELIIY